MGALDLEDQELRFLENKGSTPVSVKRQDVEIERTYLCKSLADVEKHGKLSHYVEHYYFDMGGEIVRMVDKYIRKKDPKHTYKKLVKKTISGTKRIEMTDAVSKVFFDHYLQEHKDQLIGITYNAVYKMENDQGVVLVRRFPNGKTIITGEQEFPSEETAKNFKLPEWGLRDVTEDPKYRGYQMSIDNFV